MECGPVGWGRAVAVAVFRAIVGERRLGFGDAPADQAGGVENLLTGEHGMHDLTHRLTHEGDGVAAHVVARAVETDAGEFVGHTVEGHAVGAGHEACTRARGHTIPGHGPGQGNAHQGRHGGAGMWGRLRVRGLVEGAHAADSRQGTVERPDGGRRLGCCVCWCHGSRDGRGRPRLLLSG